MTSGGIKTATIDILTNAKEIEMNKERRKLLNQIQTEIEAIKERTERILEAEQEAFENMPEGLQQSERGEKTESAIGCIEYIMQSLDEAIEQINEACE